MSHRPPSPCEFHDLSGVDERSIHIEQDSFASYVDELTHHVNCRNLSLDDKPITVCACNQLTSLIRSALYPNREWALSLFLNPVVILNRLRRSP